MVWLRAMMLLAGTFAVLWLGGVSTQAVADAPPTSCHEAMVEQGVPDKPHHAPDKAMKTMACCVVCVAGPDLPVVRSMKQRTDAPVSGRIETLPTGRTPAPEHGPPKA